MLKSNSLNSPRYRQAFTLVELLTVIAIIGILVGMFFPATRGSRSAARRSLCLNNMRQLVLGVHNYEAAHEILPSAMGGDQFRENTPSHSGRLSGLIALFPFVGQSYLYEQISTEQTVDGKQFQSFPPPWLEDYPVWKIKSPALQCPSSYARDSNFGQTTYAFSIGDTARQIHNPQTLRGMFGCKQQRTFASMTDGSSNTIAFAEIGNRKGRDLISVYATNAPLSVLETPSESFNLLDKEKPEAYGLDVNLSPLGRGSHWADGAAGPSLVNTILPPNSPSCAVKGSIAVDGIYSAGSYHNDGINVAFGDGSVRYISDEIDAGDSTQATLTVEEIENNVESPFGVWGMLGTAAGGEAVDSMDY